jgi:hypothetical protein
VEGYTDVSWKVDGVQKETGASFTLDPDDYDVRTHSLTVIGTKGGKPYALNLAFTVTAGESGGEPRTVGPISTGALADTLATLPVGTPEAPTTVILNTFDVTTGVWGGTIKNALNGVEKYIILDLSACTTTENNNKISGDSTPSGNHFNIIRDTFVVGVILPNDLVEIGSNAFNGWTNIRSVTITTTNSTLTTIGTNSFHYTPNLKSFTIPASVTTIKGGVFQNSGLESITIPVTVTAQIRAGTFSPCPSLTVVTFESDTMNLANDSFEGNLHTVYNESSPKAGTYTKTGGMGTSSTWEKTN